MRPFHQMQAADTRLITGGGPNRGRREEQTVGIRTSKKHLMTAAAFVFAFTAAGCVSEDEGTTEPTRDAAFLGYSNPETKQTTCGNCHVDVQAEWAQTKHASAWADLQASGHASAMCNKCHTVNGLTNGQADSAGFFAVSGDAQRFYQDVQCESCHGPGASHVSAPGETQPIPTFKVDNTYGDGCTSCHNSTHHPFAEQLAISRHGEMPNWEGAAGSCQVRCHTVWGAQSVMAARGPFREMGLDPLTTTEAPGLTCQLCHEPHDAANNPAQLRFSLAAASTSDSTTHLCGKCHSRGAQPTSWTSTRGAHSAQFAVMMGTAGWRPASFGNITGPARHGTMEGNCTTCHMNTGAVNTAAGAFAVQNVGHSFEVIPCLNAASVGTGGIDTTAAGCTEEQRDFSACGTSNCHGSQESARHAMDLLQTEITNYINVLWVDTDNDGQLDAAPTDGGWLATILQHDAARAVGTKRFGTSGADAIETVAKGARFNAFLAYSFQGHADGSRGVHNPAYMRALMQKTIDIVRTTYATTDTLSGVPPVVAAAMARGARR